MRVLKVGGRAQGDPRLAATIAAAWAAAPGTLVLVHGGGDEISALQHRLGIAPAFVGGRRVTRQADVELIRMALSGTANKRLVSALLDAGVPAVGVSGEDGGLLVARQTPDEEMGFVGVAAQASPRVLHALLAAGFLPVVSPVARDRRGGGALNVNADEGAAALAAALGATELLLVSDVAAVRVHGVACPRLEPDEARALVASGVARDGMAAKLEAAIAVLELGVPLVRIGDVTAIADATAGTLVRAGLRSPSLLSA